MRPERRPERERAARLVRVDVDLQRSRVADHEQRVAQLVQLRLERLGVELLALDHEDGAVAELGELLVDCVEACLVSLFDRRVRDRFPGQRRRDAADDLEQAGSAGVDDARLAQHVELVGRTGERVLAALDQLLQQRRGLERSVARVLGLLGELPDHGEHRPLDRAPHSPVGGVAGGAERPSDRRCVEEPGLAERLGGAAQDLGEDDAGVAARAHQRRPRQLLRECGPVVGGGGLEHLHDRARGQRQVRAGVAVGDGIDVEVVDPAAVRLERCERGLAELLGPLELRHADLRTSSMCTSTAATWRPVSRSSS